MARHNRWDTKKFNTMSQSKPEELKTDEDRDTCGGYEGLDCIALKKPDGYVGKNMYYPHQGVMILYEDPKYMQLGCQWVEYIRRKYASSRQDCI